MKTLPSPLGRFIAIATCSFLIGHATAQPTVQMGTNFPCSELMVTLQPTDGNCIDIPPYLPYTQDLALYPDLNYQLPSGTHLQSITITYNGSLLYHWYCSQIMPSPLNTNLPFVSCDGNNVQINMQGGPIPPAPYSYEFKLSIR